VAPPGQPQDGPFCHADGQQLVTRPQGGGKARMHAQHARAAARRFAAEVHGGRELRRQQRGAAEAGVDLDHEDQTGGHESGRRR
jgi:hypothetical protein